MAVLRYVYVDVPPDDYASQTTYYTYDRCMDTLHYVSAYAPSYYSDA